MPESQPFNSLTRLLLPSARDIIFIMLFWSILAGPLSTKPLADADIGWHIRIGERILATHSIPHTDPFSSTMRGHPWVAWEWLYDVALGIVHRAMGLNGVVWLAALLIAATMTLLIGQLVRSGTGLPLAIVLMLLVEMAAAVHLYARPHIVSWLLNLLWLIALERWEQGSSSRFAVEAAAQTPSWLPWFFPLSMVLWVNLHGGWIVGLALLAVYAIAAAIESVREADVFARIRARHRARAMGWALAWSAVVTVVNPYGLRLHQHIYRYLGDRYLMDRIDEFRSPNFHGWSERAFAVLLVLTIAAFPGRQRKVRARHLLITLLAAYSGFYATRNLPVSAMILAVVIGPILWQNFKSISERAGAVGFLRSLSMRLTAFTDRMDEQELQLRGHLWAVLAVLVALALCLAAGRPGAPRWVHSQFDPQHMPVAAVEYLSREESNQSVFAPDSWGGYLIYRLYPTRQVVIDDRHDFYGAQRIRDYLVLTQAEPRWNDVLQDWQIRTILFPRNATLVGLLRQLPAEWKVVYEDKVAVIMEKNGG